jgi:cell division protein FtsB
MSKPPTHRCATPDETVSGMIVSMFFWLCLMTSATFFAMVALSPKLTDYLRLRDLRATNQFKLVAVETQNAQLQRVIEAIEDDKDFATEMTRVEFDAVRSDEEIIPVSPHLKLDAQQIVKPVMQPAIVPEWYREWLDRLSTDASLRQALLGAAGLLVVISFTWFQPASSSGLAQSGLAQNGGSSSGPSIWQAIRARYVRAE